MLITFTLLLQMPVPHDARLAEKLPKPAARTSEHRKYAQPAATKPEVTGTAATKPRPSEMDKVPFALIQPPTKDELSLLKIRTAELMMENHRLKEERVACRHQVVNLDAKVRAVHAFH